MDLSAFDYALPTELIARFPKPNRVTSRLLCVSRAQQELQHRNFCDIACFLRASDLLVLNDTAVFPARFEGAKIPQGGKVSVLIERILPENQVLAHLKSNNRLKIRAKLKLANAFECAVLGRSGRLFLLQFPEDPLTLAHQFGEIPLPPYLKRQATSEDKVSYQTVYAQETGSVAAPTAGLHFDRDLLHHLENLGVKLAYLTLHVGAGTFLPIEGEDLSKHQMHSEYLTVSSTVCDQIQQTKQQGGRVFAVGTTTTRALETAALSGVLQPFEGETRLFITPGFEFKVIDGLLTNFHLPRSTLLVLVSAFAGYDLTRQTYQEAVDQRYRFFSYGDAMLIYE